MTRGVEDVARDEGDGGERKDPGERLGERMSEAEKRAFAEVVREAYRGSTDVEDEVEECLRLGREEPPDPESSKRICERFFRKLQERGEIDPEEDPRALAEGIVSGRSTEGGRPGT